MSIIVEALVFLAATIYAYLRGYGDARSTAETECQVCQLRLRCTHKYGKEAMRIIEQDLDPTIPTNREIAAWWGLGKKMR